MFEDYFAAPIQLPEPAINYTLDEICYAAKEEKFRGNFTDEGDLRSSWIATLSDWKHLRREAALRLARQGVPTSLRCLIWQCAFENRCHCTPALYSASVKRAVSLFGVSLVDGEDTCTDGSMPPSPVGGNVKGVPIKERLFVNSDLHSDETIETCADSLRANTLDVATPEAVAFPRAAIEHARSASHTRHACMDSMVGLESTFSLVAADLPRTFPELAFFALGSPERRQLSRVLAAFAVYRPDIGYLQGFSHLAGMLLITMDSDVVADEPKSLSTGSGGINPSVEENMSPLSITGFGDAASSFSVIEGEPEGRLVNSLSGLLTVVDDSPVAAQLSVEDSVVGHLCTPLAGAVWGDLSSTGISQPADIALQKAAAVASKGIANIDLRSDSVGSGHPNPLRVLLGGLFGKKLFQVDQASATPISPEPLGVATAEVYIPKDRLTGSLMQATDAKASAATDIALLRKRIMPSGAGCEAVVFACFSTLILRAPLRWFAFRDVETLELWYSLTEACIVAAAPVASARLATHGVTVNLFLPSWLLSLFSRPLGVDAAVFLWDRFTLGGAAELLRCVAGLVKHLEPLLVSALTFEATLDVLLHVPACARAATKALCNTVDTFQLPASCIAALWELLPPGEADR